MNYNDKMAFPGRDAADHTNESSICKRAEMARFYAGFQPWRLSQRLCLSLDIGPKVRAEAALKDDVDPSCKRAFQLFDQRQIVAEIAILCHVDQEIDITVLTLVVAQHLTEQTQVGRAMTRGDGDKLITTAMEIVA